MMWDSSTSDTILPMVILGLGSGVIFMVIVFIAVARPFAPSDFDKSTLAVITDENMAMVDEMKQRARQHELAGIFFVKYPDARTDVLYLTEIELYGGEDGEFVIGHDKVASVWYSGPLLTRMEFDMEEGRDAPRTVNYQPHLIFHVYASGMMDEDEIELRCNFSYSDRDWTDDLLIKGKEEIKKALQLPSLCEQ